MGDVTAILGEVDSNELVTPVGEGLFEIPEVLGGASVLRGASCQNCGETVFPALSDCPVCVQRDVMRPVDIPGVGVIRDFVVTERGPEGFAVPYLQAFVTLDAGPTVYSMLTGVEPSEGAVSVGDRVTMVVDTFRVEGNQRFVGWKFQPEAEVGV